jgi:hypothetical protein
MAAPSLAVIPANLIMSSPDLFPTGDGDPDHSFSGISFFVVHRFNQCVEDYSEYRDITFHFINGAKISGPDFQIASSFDF